MPGLYAKGDFDLAGFAVGAAERGTLLPRVGLKRGDVAIGMPSSGLHSNGFSLVRRIVERTGLAWDAPAPFAPGDTLAKALLAPTRLYVKPLLAALKATSGISALAHITGGGFPDNLPRVLPDGLAVELDLDAFAPPPVFGWLKAEGGVEDLEMLRTFNCGFGMVAFVSVEEEASVTATLAGQGLAPKRNRAADREDRRTGRDARQGRVAMKRVKIGVLISGRGSNMAALIEAAKARDYPAEIVLVVSNKAQAPGLSLARAEGVEALALSQKTYPDKDAFESAIDAELQGARRGNRLPRRLHAHSRAGLRRALARAAPQYPSFAVARVQGPSHARARARRRRARAWLHRTSRHPRTR